MEAFSDIMHIEQERRGFCAVNLVLVKMYLGSPDFPSLDALQMVMLSTKYLLISNCLLRLWLRFRIRVRVKVRVSR
jgi:hypothetical protein